MVFGGARGVILHANCERSWCAESVLVGVAVSEKSTLCAQAYTNLYMLKDQDVMELCA